MILNESFLAMLNSPVRKLMGRVEVYEGSALTLICGCHDSLIDFTIDRVGEGKFFGFGICHRINVKLRDLERKINITTANSLEVEFGLGTDYIYPFPRFYVSEVHRDENTNELSITAYDRLYNAVNYTVSELGLVSSYTIGEFATACGTALGLPVSLNGLSGFDVLYSNGANFEGTETLRDALNAIAEATQTIYFINWDWQLTFKRLEKDSNPVLTIDKNLYFTLENSDNRRLQTITHATELGDNVSASITAIGSTQFVRDNPFYELREDIDSLLDSAIAAIGGLSINQFSCNWRGNFLLEIGDKIELITKDDNSLYSYLLNDSLTFNGSLSQDSEWTYEESEADSDSNPSNLGDALRQTYARVDKANREIELVARKADNNEESISNLILTTESISASVSRVEESANNSFSSLNDGINTLTATVEAKMSADDVKLEISTALASGVDKVVTSTGFTFNEEGLTVSKSGSEMETTITEDGMTVYRDAEAVLTANNVGVDAVNLHATTYLIIGKYSRLEDYGDGRTGCFWIGG
jgi:hypothetical protein